MCVSVLHAAETHQRCQALLAAPSGFTIKDIIKLKNTYKHFIISTFSFIFLLPGFLQFVVEDEEQRVG